MGAVGAAGDAAAGGGADVVAEEGAGENPAAAGGSKMWAVLVLVPHAVADFSTKRRAVVVGHGSHGLAATRPRLLVRRFLGEGVGFAGAGRCCHLTMR